MTNYGYMGERSAREKRERLIDTVAIPPVVVPPAPEDSPFVFGFHDDCNAFKRRKMEVCK